MASYPKTFCTVSLPLGPDPREGQCSAIKMCSSGTSWREALKCWQRTAAVGDTLRSQLSRQQSRRERSSGKRRELASAREQRHRHPPRTTTHMQQLQQGLPFEDRPLQPQPALRLYHGLTSTGANFIVSRDRRMRTTIKSSQFNRFKKETSACIIIGPGNRPGSPILKFITEG